MVIKRRRIKNNLLNMSKDINKSTMSIDVVGRRKSSIKPKLNKIFSMMTEVKLLPPRAIKQVRTYQPTYQLNPRKRFKEDDVKRILKRIVDAELEEVEYSDKEIPELILGLSETIRNAIKEENYNRYRILVTVTIGQRRQQSVQMFHSFLWDHERDGFAFYNYENPHIFANVTAYAVYLD